MNLDLAGVDVFCLELREDVVSWKCAQCGQVIEAYSTMVTWASGVAQHPGRPSAGGSSRLARDRPCPAARGAGHGLPGAARTAAAAGRRITGCLRVGAPATTHQPLADHESASAGRCTKYGMYRWHGYRMITSTSFAKPGATEPAPAPRAGASSRTASRARAARRSRGGCTGGEAARAGRSFRCRRGRQRVPARMLHAARRSAKPKKALTRSIICAAPS